MKYEFVGYSKFELWSAPVCSHIGLDIMQAVNKSVVDSELTEVHIDMKCVGAVSSSAVKTLHCKELSILLSVYQQ
jgi:hypothetical protein